MIPFLPSGSGRWSCLIFCLVTGCQRLLPQCDQGRSEAGLALFHFSGWACFLDLCQGAFVRRTSLYLRCVGCFSIDFLHHCFNYFLISANFLVIAVSGWFEQ